MILNEELFEDNILTTEAPAVELEQPIAVDEITPTGPQPGQDMGAAMVITDMITATWNSINDLNSAIVSINDNVIKDILQDIANERIKEVGMFEAALEKISPNISEIETGKAELEAPITEGLK